jgi:hypothetical protein
MTSREGREPAPANPRPRSTTGRLAETIREAFRKVARAVTAIAISPAQRRKRKEETQGSFKLARAITRRVKRATVDPWEISDHVPTLYDEAEYFLRRLLDEWADADNHHAQEQDAGFHYASNADFDPQP